LAGVFAAVVGMVLVDAVVLTPMFGSALGNIEDALVLMFLVGLAMAMGLLVSSTERSKRRAMEERAEAHARELAAQQVQAHMDEFLATASHDLRSPLTAVCGYIDLATRSYTSLAPSVLDTRPDLAVQIERVREHLDLADQSSERLHRLVEVLFDTSKAHVGNLNFTPAPCDLAGLVREQVAAIQVSAPQRTVELEEPGGGPVEVLADADRIGQVITNYLTNALKYSPATRPVQARVGIADGRARVAVEDHGPGLPASEQERIWQQYYRAEGVQAQSAMGGSLGLGLHVCKRIIEGHGGTFGVHSEVGHGSTFWFELPLANESTPRLEDACRASGR
jgi:signal transduction histidine kinase